MSWHLSTSRRRFADTSGFTLIETLVAFSVLAMLLAVLFRGVVGMRADAYAFDARTQASLVARTILEEALSNRALRNGTTSGTRDGRHWSLKAEGLDLAAQLPHGDRDPQGPPPPSQDASKKPVWTPQRVVVRVETGGRPIEIEAVRLAEGS